MVFKACRICGGQLRDSSVSDYYQCSKCRIMIRKHNENKAQITGGMSCKGDIFHAVRLFVTNKALRKELPHRKLRILEIGFGSGILLAKFAKEGHICWGIESDAVFVNSLSQKLSGFKNVTLLWKNLEDAELPRNFFDLVYMLHVVEHLYDPYLSIRKIRECLRQDGRLFIITPNTESYGAKLFKGDWWPFEPTHRQLFAPKNLRMLLESKGFQSVKIEIPPIFEGFTTEVISLLRWLKLDNFHPHLKFKFAFILLLILLFPLLAFIRAVSSRAHSNMKVCAKLR